MNDYCVYMYVFGNGNKYVGQSKNLKRRMRQGFGGGYNEYVIKTKNKYGILRIEILGRGLNQEEANKCEIKGIKDYNTLNDKYGGLNPKGLNFKDGGFGGGENHPRSLLTNNQVYVIRLRLAMGDQHKEIAESFNVSRGVITSINNGVTKNDPNIVYPINPHDQSKLMKGKFTGEKHFFYGLHRSDETKNKISESLKGRYIDEYNPYNKYSKNLKEKAIVLALLGFKYPFICGLLDINDKSNICHWKNGRNIGSIDLDECNRLVKYIKENPERLLCILRGEYNE